MDERAPFEVAELEARRLVLPLLFALSFVVAGIVVQVTSPTPPWRPASPIDFFTASLLWMLSLLSLLMANQRLTERRRLLFWLGSCAGLAILAIDEMLEYHERTRHVVRDDDHIKVAAWVAAAIALSVLRRVERLPRLSAGLLGLGYFFQSMYTLVDIGDGDYFRLPWFSTFTLFWAEELFELFSLTSYMLGFLFLYGVLSLTFARKA